MPKTIALSVGFWFMSCSFISAHEPPIFEKPIASQPFDLQPFRPIHIPAWVQNITGVGYTLSGMNYAQRELAVKHGVTISEMNFVDPFYPYYNSKLLKKRSPHVPLDRIHKEIAEYKKLGVRILAVYPPTLQGEVYENHPDWRRIPTNTREIPQTDMKKFPHGGMLCLLGPYGDFFVDMLVEILQTHPEVDAFSFDGLHHGGGCYCEHCRKAYKEVTGQDIPNTNLNDSAFRHYQHWADRRLEAVVAKAQQRLKQIKPEVALVTWTTNSGRYGHFLSIPRNMSARMNLLFDAPDQEFWLDESNRGNTIVPAFANAYAWSVTNHRVACSEPYLMSHGNPYGKDSFPIHEVERRMMLALTYGAGPSIAVGQPARLQQGIYHSLDEVQKRRPWLINKSPEPWAALLMSDNTKTFYGREAGRVEERYLANVFGMFRAMIETHLPVTVINDWNLTFDELQKYPVLILPNAASLDEKQAKAIEQYVANGGGLIASLDTSLFDEFGDPRSNFALQDLLGVTCQGVIESNPIKSEIDVNFAKAIGPEYWEKRKNVFDFRLKQDSFLNKEKVRKHLDAEPVTFKGSAVQVAVMQDVQVHATIQVKDLANATPFPAITSRVHGKGRVIYFAAGLDAAYYRYAYPYQRSILESAVEWVSDSQLPPVKITAPMCVHTTIMRQQAESRLIVHLFNNINTAGGHAFPDDDVPLREETLPIHDITVTFRKDYAIKSVRWQPSNVELPMQVTADGIMVKIPRLDIHGMVVAELKAK
jgi:hypothetical protein